MICLDTNVLIWGVQGVSHPDQVGMIERTRRFLRRLADDGDRVMVPSVVLGEYIQNFPEAEVEAQVTALTENFFVPSLDTRCAVLAAELQKVGVLAAGVPGSRIALKADCQIIATAICHGASRIVTGNVVEFRRIAQNRIPISDVPETMEQAELLEVAEFPDGDDSDA